MREIKFRGKEGKTGKWLYGVFFKHERYTRCPFITSGEEMPPPEYVYLIINSGFSDWNLPRPIDAYSIDPVTVGQYTGLKDKNGVEIYEGDILRVSRRRLFIVTWNNDIGGWVNKPVDGKPSYPCFNTGTVKGMEIVGNIHDNPELLEGSA